MPQNLEVKIKLKSFNEIKTRLNKIGADFAGTLNQKDIYYKNSGGLLKLRIENGTGSLIHYNRNENSKNRWSDYSLLKLNDGNAEKFFNKAFKVEIIVEKKRLLYMYKNTRIHLDKIKRLGNYLELETLVLNGQTDARNRFKELVALLNLDMKSQIRKSNRDLMLGKRK